MIDRLLGVQVYLVREMNYQVCQQIRISIFDWVFVVWQYVYRSFWQLFKQGCCFFQVDYLVLVGEFELYRYRDGGDCGGIQQVFFFDFFYYFGCFFYQDFLVCIVFIFEVSGKGWYFFEYECWVQQFSFFFNIFFVLVEFGVQGYDLVGFFGLF